MHAYSGYVPLPATKIDFSSDLERPDPNQKKKKKVKERRGEREGGGGREGGRGRERKEGGGEREGEERVGREGEREKNNFNMYTPNLSVIGCCKNFINLTTCVLCVFRNHPLLMLGPCALNVRHTDRPAHTTASEY